MSLSCELVLSFFNSAQPKSKTEVGKLYQHRHFLKFKPFLKVLFFLAKDYKFKRNVYIDQMKGTEKRHFVVSLFFFPFLSSLQKDKIKMVNFLNFISLKLFHEENMFFCFSCPVAVVLCLCLCDTSFLQKVFDSLCKNSLVIRSFECLVDYRTQLHV